MVSMIQETILVGMLKTDRVEYCTMAMKTRKACICTESRGIESDVGTDTFASYLCAWG